MVKLIAWNIGGREAAWPMLLDSEADIALLQEAKEPPADISPKVKVATTPWHTGAHRPWRAAVVQLSDRVDVEWIPAKPLAQATAGELGVSRPGTLEAALITLPTGVQFIAVSVYGAWEEPHQLTGGDFDYADASVHRLISDLSVFTRKTSRLDILVAGDLNIFYGHGEHGDAYWAARYDTVFSRMTALGFRFVGPQAPNGRRAEPWPEELPRTSDNVPTYYAKHQTPATCTRQLDFVFASEGLAERVRATALNEPEQWGPSDHCRVEIRVA
jgi:exonuclease III